MRRLLVVSKKVELASWDILLYGILVLSSKQQQVDDDDIIILVLYEYTT
jgi:hypothetical protein